MIDIEKISTEAYEKHTINKTIEKYNIAIDIEYYSIPEEYKIDLTCNIKGESLYGTVYMIIDRQELISKGKLKFDNLSVPSRAQGKGVGTILMKEVIKIAKAYGEYFGIQQKHLCIYGWLSKMDCKNNWSKSLPFYQKIAIENKLDVVFKERSSGCEYKNFYDYLKFKSYKDGDVIFKFKI